MDLEQGKELKQVPEWYSERSLLTVEKGYLRGEETPRDMYMRVANSAAKYSKRPDLAKVFFEVMWRGWLGPATPILCNLGTDGGLPISCFKTKMQDSIDGIFNTVHEVAMMSKVGGGVGVAVDSIRPRGSEIKTGGKSNGVVPWCKCVDVAVDTVSQSNRRGSASANLSIEHPDFFEFLEMRDTVGDPTLRVQHLHHCVTIPDSFMHKVKSGDVEARYKWERLLLARWETGEPYILFTDHVNNNNPQVYKDRGFTVEATNICTEILQYLDKDHSVVCCLSSLNLAKWEEWKDRKIKGMSIPEISIRFLDAVIEEFIQRAKDIPGLEKAVRGAIKARSLGLGVMGWHSLLQSKMLPFDTSMEVMRLNAQIAKFIRDEADKATRSLAEEYGEPEWLIGYGKRNVHLLANAPTRSNANISGGISFSTEPWTANFYLDESAKGDFPVKNHYLEPILKKYGKDDHATWKSILRNDGSVQHLSFLTDREKEVFKTAREINQKTIVQQAIGRQQYVDQGQSTNLFFPVNSNPKYVHETHMLAWELGLKTLYYLRTGSVIKGDIIDECISCEG